ncbi:hypothetical protein [Agromyces aureus]|uniref:Uncharacterized protein n=1 Tax=Agromyces aureus TaxID=453304 RepID=A0A191WJV6_9MICO|nr:hypothetical protein [Agromyces aureus]ANJ28502.1 hypothetical protein ATC03_19180 [Agromyces aureus]
MSEAIPADLAQPNSVDTDDTDLSGEPTRSRFSRALGRLPYLLSSAPVIVFGILLFFYLVVYAGIASLLGDPGAVSTNTQLILGNYTNVTSSVGAGIAAGGSLTMLKRQRRNHRISQAALDAANEARSFALETHRLLHHLHPEQAAALGQSPGRLAELSTPSPQEPKEQP